MASIPHSSSKLPWESGLLPSQFKKSTTRTRRNPHIIISENPDERFPSEAIPQKPPKYKHPKPLRLRIPKLHTPVKPNPSESRYAPAFLRKIVWERDCGQCQYCGEEVSYQDCNIDHVIPWPYGPTVEENLIVACQECNRLKKNYWIPIQFRPIPGVVKEGF